MTLYAYTENSYRAISAADQATAGETVGDAVPKSVLDAITTTEQTSRANNATLRDRADQALTDLRAYRDLASPTNAQTLAIVKLLCRVSIGLIRLLLHKLDGAD